jgi:ABC-type polysaccharide/polyol phosphate export permease
MTITLNPVTPAPPSPRGRLRRHGRAAFTGLANEIRKYLLNYLTEWRGTMVQLAVFPSVYLLLVLYMGRGKLDADLLLPVLIGVVPLTLLHEQVNRAFWGLLGDIQAGVLEQTYLTPLPSWVLVLGRQVASMVTAVPLAIATYLAGLAAIDAEHARIPFSIQIVIPMSAMALGIIGLALILSGLTLVFKRIEIVTEASMAAPLLLSGAFFPLSRLPEWVQVFGQLLVPITPGVEAIRDILLRHRSLATLQTGWGLGWLLAQPVLLIAIGGLLFTWMERIAMRRGTLGRY